jgi:hypothetical protein
MRLFIGKICLTCLLVFPAHFCYPQKEKIFSAGISADYGFGEEVNNFAATVKLHYYPFQKFRMVPSFSYYSNKNDARMNIFSFNFNYLFPDLISDFFPTTQNNNVIFYPVAGFCIANVAKSACPTCSKKKSNSASNYFYNFGFNFGAGIDYDLQALLSAFRDVTANFEIQYQILENYVRPQISLGIVYDF